MASLCSYEYELVIGGHGKARIHECIFTRLGNSNRLVDAYNRYVEVASIGGGVYYSRIVSTAQKKKTHIGIRTKL